MVSSGSSVDDLKFQLIPPPQEAHTPFYLSYVRPTAVLPNLVPNGDEENETRPELDPLVRGRP